jgi:hypothetical protein
MNQTLGNVERITILQRHFDDEHQLTNIMADGFTVAGDVISTYAEFSQ